MKKEIQQFLDYPDDKLEKIRKQFFLCVWMMFLSLLSVTALFFFSHFYLGNDHLSILLLFAMVCIMSGSLFSRQTLRHIELIQELKKLKSNQEASSNWGTPSPEDP
jgi:hypothetical protein